MNTGFFFSCLVFFNFFPACFALSVLEIVTLLVKSVPSNDFGNKCKEDCFCELFISELLYINMLMIFRGDFVSCNFCLSVLLISVESFGFFGYKIMSSGRRNNLISSFSIYIPFISPSCLLWAKLSTILSRSAETRNDFQIIVAIFLAFLHSIDVISKFSYLALIVFVYVHSLHSLFKDFCALNR